MNPQMRLGLIVAVVVIGTVFLTGIAAYLLNKLNRS